MLRRFSAIGLMLVVGLATGCGGSGEPRRETSRSLCTTDVSKGAGVRLVYRVRPDGNGRPTEDQLRTTAELLCRRLEGLGRTRPAISVQGDVVTVIAPEGAPRPALDWAGSRGRIAFLDWEAALLDDDCRSDPRISAQARSPLAGRASAARLAARCKGAVLVRQQRPDPQSPRPDAWWIVRRDPVLGPGDIRDPAADTDPDTGEPIVTMEFSEAGRRAFTRLTRRIARRGAAYAKGGADPEYAAHHFAILLDRDLVSTPFIDFQESPDGFSGEHGAQIAGGLTEDDARVLARMLEIGPLPVRLQPVGP